MSATDRQHMCRPPTYPAIARHTIMEMTPAAVAVPTRRLHEAPTGLRGGPVGVAPLGSADAAEGQTLGDTMKEEPMRAWQQPHALALTIGAILALALSLFITYGIGGVLVLGLASLLGGNYLAHRYVATHLAGHYPRHGEHMD
jgi:hypothetical protein